MTYEDFKNEYTANFNLMMKYSPSQVGSSIYAEKMASLADSYPDFLTTLENE